MINSNHSKIIIGTSHTIVLNPEFWFIVLCSLVWMKTGIISFAVNIINDYIPLTWVSDVCVAILVVPIVLLSLPYVLKRIRHKDLYAYICFVFLYFFSVIIFDNKTVNNYLIDNIYTILFVNLPIFFVGAALDNEKKVLPIFRIISILTILINVAGILITGIGNMDLSDGMGRSYRLLPHACLLFYYLLRRFNFIDLVCLAFAFVLILGFGTRGTILLLLIYFLLAIVFVAEKKKRNTILFFVFLILIVIITNFDSIVSLLSNLLAEMGLNIRIFDSLQEKSFFAFNSRDVIGNLMLGVFKENAVFGLGVAGDRLYMNTYIAGNSGIAYSHNLFIELLVSYGAVLGGALIIAICSFLFLGFTYTSRKQERRVIFLVLFTTGFLKLFISSSYLVEPMFPLLLGFCVSTIRLRHKRNNYVSKGVGDVCERYCRFSNNNNF